MTKQMSGVAMRNSWLWRSSILVSVMALMAAMACTPKTAPVTSQVSEGGQIDVELDWLIRRDVDAVLEIERQSFQEPWSREMLVSVLSKKSTIGFVAKHKGKVVGFAIYSLYRNSIHLENLAVHSSYRRKGVARSMLSRIQERLGEQNRQFATVIVRESNFGAQTMLKSAGWQAPLKLKKFYTTSKDAALVFVHSVDKLPVHYALAKELLVLAGVSTESAIEGDPDASIEEQKALPPAARSKKSRGSTTPPEVAQLAERYTNLTVSISQDEPPFELTDTRGANAIRMALQRREVGSVVILAEAGTGKTELVKSFVWQMAQGQYPELASDTPIFQIDAGSLSANTSLVGQIEGRIKEFTDAAAKAPLILFIDEIHSLSGQGTHSANSNDVWEYLKPHLADGRIRIIGTSTEQEFNAAYAGRTAVYSRFEQYKKPPLSRAEAVAAINLWAKRFGIEELPQPLCERLYDLSEQFDAIGAQPRKVAKLVDYLHAKRSIEDRTEQPISFEEVHAAAQEKYQLDPAQFDQQKMRQKIEGLRAAMSARFVDRAPAIEALYQATKQSSVRLPGDQKADMIMLLMGPRGTGKTEFAKAYAENMGYRSRLIEMNAYSRTGGRSSEDLMQEIAEAVRANSQAVIILDEIEKADRATQDRLLAAFQEGAFYVTEKTSSGDQKGTSIRVSLRNVKILLTTNAGQDYITGGGSDPYQMREAGIRDGLSELLVDRIQGVLPFTPAMDRDAFARILTEHLQRQIQAYEAVPGNPPLAVEDRDQLIAEIVQKHWRGTGTSPRAAISEVDARLKGAVTDALYEHGGTGVGPCDLLYVRFGSF